MAQALQSKTFIAAFSLTHLGSLASLAIGLVLQTAACAQEKPPVPPGSKPVVRAAPSSKSPRNLEGAREFDRVVGIIGDKVILRSEIEDQLAETKLSKEERKAQERAVLEAIARDQIWIQYGKVLAPAEVDQFIDRRLKQYQNEQIKDYGSFTKMNEELALIDNSWENLREIKRNEYLAHYAQTEAWRRHAGLTGTMLVTPKMMRTYYDDHPDYFSEQSAAEIAIVFVPKTMTLMELQSIRTTWQEERISAAKLAEKFPGLRAQESVVVTAESSSREFIETFAKANSEGAVSEPIPRGQVNILLKVTRKVEAKQQSFDEVATQQRIRVELTQKKMERRQSQLLFVNQHKVFIWPHDLLSAF